ncbi:MAG: (2Fe-2S)-binding protein [Firmicutes bacterium]|nr:(2Fe-2S)-binding protein [Bacillota bacterium]
MAKQSKPEKTPRGSGNGLSRRDFLKGTGAAVSAGVLVTEDLLRAQGQRTGPVVGPGPVPITLRINGQPRQLTVEPRTTLLDALRNHLDLTGAKKVCDRGTCGACTVHLDGRAIYACTMLAIDAARGQEITTIEGLAPPEQLHPVSAAFVEHDAQQCGFCTPGFVMAAVAYLRQNPNPTYEQVTHALGGNLCRCGTYMGVRHAVVEAAMRGKGGRS